MPMTNEEIRAFFWDRVEGFELGGEVDVEAMIRVFSVSNPNEMLDSVLGGEVDPVRYLALEVAELYREGWRSEESSIEGWEFFAKEDSPLKS